MTSSGLLNTGFLWRAVVVSLLLHALLLLQSPRVPVTPEPPLVAVLRSEAKTRHSETPMGASSSAKTEKIGRYGETSDSPAAPIPPPTAAAAPPKAESIAMDAAGEAGKSYLFALAREMRHERRVAPAPAARFAGTSEIRIAVGSAGAAPQLFKSSGYAELDQAALAMVSAALQRTPVPVDLLGEAFDLVLPISFEPAE